MAPSWGPSAPPPSALCCEGLLPLPASVPDHCCGQLPSGYLYATRCQCGCGTDHAQGKAHGLGSHRKPAKGPFGTVCSSSENCVCSSCWFSQGKSPLGLKPSFDLVPSSLNTYVSDLLSSSLTPPGNLTGKRRAEPALLPQASPLPDSHSLPPGPGSPLRQCSLLLHQWMPPEAFTAAASTWWGSHSGLRAQCGMADLEGGA